MSIRAVVGVPAAVVSLKYLADPRKHLERAGVAFVDGVAQLPDGWVVGAGDASWCWYWLDEHGRKRAAVDDEFDELTVIPLRRYSYNAIPVDGRLHRKTSLWLGIVTDQGVAIWRSSKLRPRVDHNSLLQESINWLNEHFPDWLDPVAYWDKE